MDKNKMDKIRKKFFKDEIMTAITKMIDTPDNNGIYTDYKCLNEIVEISERYWNTELCDAHDALRAMRALNKATLNNLSSRDEEIRELKAFKKIHYPLLESSNKAAEQLKAKIKKLMDALKFIIGTAKTIEDAEKVAKKTLKDISYE